MSFGYQVLGFGSGGIGPTVDIEYLCIAGGGSGGNVEDGNSNSSSGGGAGGFLAGTMKAVIGEEYDVAAGAGGAGTTADGPGLVGVDSTISGSGVSITSDGGGYGNVSGDGGDGGSGGGGGNNALTTPDRASVGGTATSGQGYDGGVGGGGDPAPFNSASGGGGGAGAAGQDSSGTAPGATNGAGGNGGSGYTAIRVPSAYPSPSITVAPGTNGKADDGGETVCTYTVSGTFQID